MYVSWIRATTFYMSFNPRVTKEIIVFKRTIKPDHTCANSRLALLYSYITLKIKYKMYSSYKDLNTQIIYTKNDEATVLTYLS